MKILDLTHMITEDIPVFPGTKPPRLAICNSYEEDGFQETLLTITSHTGTHMDAPGHLYADRTKLDAFPVSQFAGRALVVDCRMRKAGEAITMAQITPVLEKAKEADFLLFCTGWDQNWGTEAYFGDYPCVDEEVLDFVIATKKKGVGFDTIGIDPIQDMNLPRHKKLLHDHEIVIIENLTHLEQCGEDPFWLFALPLRYKNADGSPLRVVAFWAE